MEKTGKVKAEIEKRSGWGNIDAIKNKNIYDDINPDLLLRAGPRLFNGLEELAKRIHSKVFAGNKGKNREELK